MRLDLSSVVWLVRNSNGAVWDFGLISQVEEMKQRMIALKTIRLAVYSVDVINNSRDVHPPRKNLILLVRIGFASQQP